MQGPAGPARSRGSVPVPCKDRVISVALVSSGQQTANPIVAVFNGIPKIWTPPGSSARLGGKPMADHMTHQDAPVEQPPAGPAHHYLDGLNPAQRQAVETLDGPVLVLAGAGTGKTRVLTTRLAHLLATDTARPWSLLAVTFTNRAAREMRERVAQILGDTPPNLWLGTFHALSARILRRHAELVGLQPNYIILDTDDQIRLLKQILAAADIDEKRWPARMLINTIQRWKDRGLVPADVPDREAGELVNGRMTQIYTHYQERLLELNAVDFGDLLLHCLQLFRANPDVLASYHDRFSHILVDEYQDTNVAQYLWLRLLAQARNNLCCVGDEDQSIYSWRGAEIGNILRFESDFPGASVIRLEQNYRSTSRVLTAASALIAHNRDRLGKTLWTDGVHGEKILLHSVRDGEEEASTVAERIDERHRAGTPLSEMAILVRAGFQTRAFEECFLKRGIPYRVIGGARFYERLEIRDAIAYLRVIRHPDDDLALERILNRPKRGIGSVTMKKLHGRARADGVSLWSAIRTVVQERQLRAGTTKTLDALLGEFERWQALEASTSPDTLAATVLDESGYTGMWMAENTIEATGRLENLKELVSSLAEFDTLDAFIEHIGLVMDNASDQELDQTSVMTIHAAKGLEFDVVFLPGWEDALFPHRLSLESRKGLEEERRLAYVALTRARKAVEISHAASRLAQGSWMPSYPSRFLGELPGKHVDERRAHSFLPYGRQWRNVRTGSSAGTSPAVAAPRRGPGYHRRRQPAGGAPPREGDGYLVDRSTAPDWTAGDRVFHQKFGMGTIESVDGDKLDIAFDKADRKMVIARFVKRP